MKHIVMLISTFLLSLCFVEAREKSTFVTVKTNYGKFTLRLYDDTPLHRDNFVKLCNEKKYEGLLFHRVIKEFIIQGGDPESKTRIPDALYGDGDGGYTVPAEIFSHYFNKRGALIDAKLGDDENPLRASAGTHFCVVQGKLFNDQKLDEIEQRINKREKEYFYYRALYDLELEQPTLADPANEEELIRKATLLAEQRLDSIGPYRFTEEQRNIYKTIGGAPHLDGSVTIFGEIDKGQEVIEKITLLGTDKNDRPLKDVVILSTKVFRKKLK